MHLHNSKWLKGWASLRLHSILLPPEVICLRQFCDSLHMFEKNAKALGGERHNGPVEWDSS